MRGFPDKLKKEYLAVALLVGILCLILAIPVKKETINETNTAIEEKNEDLKEGAWQEQIQARLQNMLNESEGAGETKVFLTFENSWENVVEKDENQTVFQKDATGNQTPYVKMQKYPKISGVLILAKGADNPVVVQNIQEAVQALFQVEAHRIKGEAWVKKIFKKNQVIITALAIMIAVAGYINYSDTHLGMDKVLQKTGAVSDTSDTEAQETAGTDGIVEEIDSLDYDLTDESALLEENQAAGDNQAGEASASAETPGEAVLTGASTFAAQAKLNREQVRSANKETLMGIINNENIGEDKKQEAIASMVEMTDLAEQEEAAELLLEAKGFANVVVNLTNESADIIVPQEYMADDKRAQIEDIVKRKTSVPIENIVITPLEAESSDGE